MNRRSEACHRVGRSSCPLRALLHQLSSQGQGLQARLAGLCDAHEEAGPVGVLEQQAPRQQLVQQAAGRPRVGWRARALLPPPVVLHPAWNCQQSPPHKPRAGPVGAGPQKFTRLRAAKETCG